MTAAAPSLIMLKLSLVVNRCVDQWSTRPRALIPQ